MIPPYVGAIAWVQLLNPSVGYLNEILKFVFGLETAPFDIYTMAGLGWVLTLFYSPFAFITIHVLWRKWIRLWRRQRVSAVLLRCVLF